MIIGSYGEFVKRGLGVGFLGFDNEVGTDIGRKWGKVSFHAMDIVRGESVTNTTRRQGVAEYMKRVDSERWDNKYCAIAGDQWV